ncbi:MULTISPECIES: hypothetical protein [Streptomyces]|uniref:hypothetical protein n=1 Tax=Streptomyces TaxID=1883 RepID=UPI0036756FA7
MQGGLTVAALVLIPLLAVAGSDGMRATFDFTTGVLTLVSLTAAVGWGLLATDRVFLSTRQRLVCQGVHRAAAVASLCFLLLHGTVKVALGHVGLLGALVPFGTGVSGTAGLIGFGALAGLLMIVAAATGAMRSAFATPGRIAGRWRALHALAYPAWCAALVHGLYAGRQPATWVVVMYMLCLTAVAAVLAMRLLPGPAKRLLIEFAARLTGPDAPPSASDPVIRTSPLPGAESRLRRRAAASRPTPPAGATTGACAAPRSAPGRSPPRKRPEHSRTNRRTTRPGRSGGRRRNTSRTVRLRTYRHRRASRRRAAPSGSPPAPSPPRRRQRPRAPGPVSLRRTEPSPGYPGRPRV